MLMSCSILCFVSGFVIRSVGFTFVPIFFVANRSDLDASCIHRLCMSLRLTRLNVAEASRCKFSRHVIPKSFAMDSQAF